MALEITVSEKEPGVYVFTLRGELNTDTYQQLEEKFKTVPERAKAAVLDMGPLSYISSMGLSTVARIQLAMEGRGGTIALVNMQPKVKLVFETMKVLSPQVFATLQEADDYLDRFLDGVQKGTIKPRDSLA